MAYPASTVFNPTLVSPFIGVQAITETSTTQKHPLGTIVKAVDQGSAQCGEAEYIYGKGVASTVAGDMCIVDSKGPDTTRTVAGSRGQAGVAMSANVASQYGWYAISGIVPVTAGTIAANAALFSTATPGSVDDAVVTGDKIDGAVSQAAASGGIVYAFLSRPSMNGNG